MTNRCESEGAVLTNWRLPGLADEQAALRRVATLVARGVSPEEVFSAVSEEVARLFRADAAVGRFEPDGSAVIIVGLTDGVPIVSLGSRLELEDYMVGTQVYRTGRPARLDSEALRSGSGPVAAGVRELGFLSVVSAPIVVEGELWGHMALTSTSKPLPPDTEERIEKFTELVGTAVANAQSRAELARLAAEQAALRRVATLVAQSAEPDEVLSAVSREVAEVLDVRFLTICRYDDEEVVVLSTIGVPDFPTGGRWPLAMSSHLASIYKTGRLVRTDDFTNAVGVDAIGRDVGVKAALGVPIVVDGAVWGSITIASTEDGPVAPAAEEPLARFTDLIATAVSNATMRTELAVSEARARQLADEQAALRRVATLIAESAGADEVFSAMAEGVIEVLDAQLVTICRYEEDEMVVLGSYGVRAFPAGSTWPLDVPSLPGSVRRTGGPVRIDDFIDARGLDATAREAGVNCAVGVPIIVDGAVWGSVNVASTVEGRFAADAEERLARFTDLIATSVHNASMRGQLAASRARVIAAADEGRRRIGRDLHDGAQQQLVTLAVALQRAKAKIPSGLDEVRGDLSRVVEGLTGALQELRDLSRGIHPAVLTEGGLSPALKALGRRAAVGVQLDVRCPQRLPDQVEVAAYYTVSEALTNAAKHSGATRAWVSLRRQDGMLQLSVRDDGAGGADPTRGSGLIGLRDRIEALGGMIEVESPPGKGTRIDVSVPVQSR